MSVIPTVATMKLFRSLTFWEKSGMEKWKESLIIRIGLNLWKLGYSAHENDDFINSSDTDFSIEDSLPEKDILHYTPFSTFNSYDINFPDILQDANIPLVKEGSRSFYLGLASILDESETYRIKFQAIQTQLEEKENDIAEIITINNQLTLISGCGVPDDWSGFPEHHNCLVVRKWCEWIPNYELLPDITASDARRKITDTWDKKPSTWWELVDNLEKSFNDKLSQLEKKINDKDREIERLAKIHLQNNIHG